MLCETGQSYACALPPRRVGPGQCAAPAPGPKRHRATCRSGRQRHRTVVHGCAIRSTAEALPPRRPATTSSRMSSHKGTPVCAATRRPVSAAADTPALLDCPRAWLSCQATFRPPVGSATRSNGRCALPYQLASQGAHEGDTGAAALCLCRCFLPPRNPIEGALRIADRSWRSAAVPLLSLVLCCLSSLLASVCNGMQQGSCVKAWPCGVHQQDGYRGLTASEGRMAYQAGLGAGGRGTGVGGRAAWGQHAPQLRRNKARYLRGTSPHSPRLEPDLPFSRHPAQHFPI
jgi:hypothetical protein